MAGPSVKNCPVGNFSEGAGLQGCVDALVSNTSGSNAVGVQFPLRVLKRASVRAGASTSLFFPAPTLTLTLIVLNVPVEGWTIKRLFNPGNQIFTYKLEF